MRAQARVQGRCGRVVLLCKLVCDVGEGEQPWRGRKDPRRCCRWRRRAWQRRCSNCPRRPRVGCCCSPCCCCCCRCACAAAAAACASACSREVLRLGPLEGRGASAGARAVLVAGLSGAFSSSLSAAAVAGLARWRAPLQTCGAARCCLGRSAAAPGLVQAGLRCWDGPPQRGSRTRPHPCAPSRGPHPQSCVCSCGQHSA